MDREASRIDRPVAGLLADLAQRGMLPPAPPELGGEEMEIEFVSPLFRAMKAEQSRGTFNNTADQYRRLAQEGGLKPEDVVFDPYAQAVAPKKAPGAAGYDPLGLLK